MIADFEAVERLKAEWTGRVVRVREGLPHLKRFAGRDGLVKTVNMTGRLLVQFGDGKGVDSAWYDLEIEEVEPIGDEPPDAPTASSADPA